MALSFSPSVQSTRYQDRVSNHDKRNMFYTVDNVYLQHGNPPILLNIISSPVSIVYLQTPIASYSRPPLIPPRQAIVSQHHPSIKVSVRERVTPERTRTPVKRSSTPLPAEAQLDWNLSQCGYRRQCVNGDGNCFFTAIASQLIDRFQRDRSFRNAIRKRLNLPENYFHDLTPLARTLRKLVCFEWKMHESKYRPYVNDVNYRDEIRKFRSDKFYSSNLGDILPLTMSNILGVHLKIFTNLSECPMIDVCPQDELDLSTPVLTLAYNQENEGHYDVAVETLP